MPTVRYDLSHSFGGTPAEQSKKSFRRIKANAGFILSQIHFNQAHWLESLTPCLQNRLEILATLAGPSDFYDVSVTVSGTVLDVGSRAAIPRVTGGLNWHYEDHAAGVLLRDGIRAAQPPAAPRIVPISVQFGMRIPSNKATLVAATSTAGAMTIRNPGNNGLVALQNLSIIQVDIIVFAAWKRLQLPRFWMDIPSGEPPGVPTPSGTPGVDTTRDTEEYGFYLKPVDEDLAVVVESDPNFEAAWDGDPPEDEAGVNAMMAALGIDLESLRKEDETEDRPRIFWRT
jgi:hypothetical protein